jgi:hypothetical protein
MLQKFKITSSAFILCLFGFTLITVSPVFAEERPEFIACQQIKTKDKAGMKEKKNCFRDYASDLYATLNGHVDNISQKDTKISDQQVKIDELTIQLETIQKTAEERLQGITELSSLLQQSRNDIKLREATLHQDIAAVSGRLQQCRADLSSAGETIKGQQCRNHNKWGPWETVDKENPAVALCEQRDLFTESLRYIWEDVCKFAYKEGWMSD